LLLEGGASVHKWLPWVSSGGRGKGSAVIARRFKGGVEAGWQWLDGVGELSSSLEGGVSVRKWQPSVPFGGKGEGSAVIARR
jgi:hypothetical protein